MGRLAPSSHTDVYLEVLETSPNPVSKSEEVLFPMRAVCEWLPFVVRNTGEWQVIPLYKRLCRMSVCFEPGYPTFKMYYHPVFKG